MGKYVKKICSIKSEYQILRLYRYIPFGASEMEFEVNFLIQLYISSLIPLKELLNLELNDIRYINSQMVVVRGSWEFPLPNLPTPWSQLNISKIGYFFPKLKSLKPTAFRKQLRSHIGSIVESSTVDFEDIGYFIKSYLIKRSNYKDAFVKRAFANKYFQLSKADLKDKQSLLTWWIDDLSSLDMIDLQLANSKMELTTRCFGNGSFNKHFTTAGIDQSLSSHYLNGMG